MGRVDCNYKTTSLVHTSLAINISLSAINNAYMQCIQEDFSYLARTFCLEKDPRSQISAANVVVRW